MTDEDGDDRGHDEHGNGTKDTNDIDNNNDNDVPSLAMRHALRQSINQSITFISHLVPLLQDGCSYLSRAGDVLSVSLDQGVTGGWGSRQV